MELPQTRDFQNIILHNTPLLDVRAPVEFKQGAFPFAQNLPLINDEERHAIGIRYQRLGKEKAIELGHKLVRGEVKQKRVAQWADFVQHHSQGVLYCFRGGLRSKISQQWIYEETGVAVPRVEGGYKALRRFLIEQMDISAHEMLFLLLGGRTGSGKTRLLKRLQHYIDLEGLYKHRGSAFGKLMLPQPSQIDIENALATSLLKARFNKVAKVVLEDESPNIGSRRLPQSLIQAMQVSSLVFLDTQIDERVDIIFEEYIVEALGEHQRIYGKAMGFDSWSAKLQAALDKIHRRLGGERYRHIKGAMVDAMQKHQTADEVDHHKTWIKALLIEYYDPMYDYQSRTKIEKVVFRGDSDSVFAYLQEMTAGR